MEGMRAALVIWASAASAVVVGVAMAGSGQQPNTGPARAGPALPSSSCADTTAVVQRAVAYVVRFGHELGSVIATEDYRQELLGVVEPPKHVAPPITIAPGVQVQPATPMTTRPALRQTLRSSFLFVQLPDDQGWVGFRDVLEVNGKRVGPDGRNRTELEVAGESSLDRWRRLSAESARYNIGSIERTLNVPTFALVVLHPGNQGRFSFTSSVEDRTADGSTCDVAFQETGSPTIVRSGFGADVPSSGTFRLEPATGRVLRSELIAGSTTAGVALKALVQYERDQKLQLWLPREMREEYAAQSGERLQCVARYSNYKRAEVTFTIRPGD
jgi:hypothetical protein